MFSYLSESFSFFSRFKLNFPFPRSSHPWKTKSSSPPPPPWPIFFFFSFVLFFLYYQVKLQTKLLFCRSGFFFKFPFGFFLLILDIEQLNNGMFYSFVFLLPCLYIMNCNYWTLKWKKIKKYLDIIIKNTSLSWKKTFLF